MKKSMKKIFLTLLSAIVLCMFFALTSFAADSLSSSISFKANAEDDNTVIHTQVALDGSEYLFLPSSADLTNLTLYFDSASPAVFSTSVGSIEVTSGVPFDFSSLFTAKADEYPVSVTLGTDTFSFTVMKSANVRSIYLVSDDPVNCGRTWVDTAKTNEATGLISLVGTDGEVAYTNTLTSLKGRGNATFTNFEKKPYQIKIGKKADLIDDGKEEKNKKWVLLANAAESTLVHNAVVFDLANALNMPFTPSYEFIDLYYDGEYRGNYMLTEKTEVDSTRVDISDTDELVEDANKDNPAYDAEVTITKTTASKGETEAAADSKGSYKYIDGLAEPELPEGCTHHAYLLEIDFLVRYQAEISGFVTERGQAVETKTPEYLTKDTGAYIAQFWQDFEDAVYSENGYNAATGKYYYEYCDLDSLVKLYLINEYTKNYDGFTSSTNFYMPEDEDIMYAGPVWDYDVTLGIGYNNRPVASNPEYFFVTKKYLINGLIQIEGFRDAVKETLDKDNGEFYAATNTLFGENGSIAKNVAIVSQSQKLNYKIWNIDDEKISVVEPGKTNTFENAIEFLNNYSKERLDWLSATTSEWSGDNYSAELDPEPSTKKNIFQLIYDFFMKIVNWFKNLFKF